MSEGTDRTRTEWSNGNEERHIDAVLGKEAAYFVARLLEHLRSRVGAHERVVPARNSTDFTTSGEILETVERHRHVRVVGQPAAIEVRADVRNDDVGPVDTSWDQAVVDGAWGEWWIVTPMHRTGGDQCDGRFSQGSRREPLFALELGHRISSGAQMVGLARMKVG